MDHPQIDMQSLGQTLQDLKHRLDQADAQINTHRSELSIAAQKVASLESELLDARNNSKESASSGTSRPKKNKPGTFTGRGSVRSWCVQMENYLDGNTGLEALNIALSYLSGNAHEWWIVFQSTADGRSITSWTDLRTALIQRFEALNKEKIVRDKLARWKQVKDVPTFNDDFNRILLDIPDMGTKDQIDWYSRGLKAYIWKALCTKEYSALSDLMRDAERVESAYSRSDSFRRTPTRTSGGTNRTQKMSTSVQGPVPMEIGNVQVKKSNITNIANFELKKLSKEERDRCMREGLCLRCRQKGHMARNCPKGRKN